MLKKAITSASSFGNSREEERLAYYYGELEAPAHAGYQRKLGMRQPLRQGPADEQVWPKGAT